ncbi:MAG: ferredoxin family 2Fe-2S iron-sulfur cluster binding protein [Rickettsia endosymbiont of Pentastiridius leporinus]
MTKIIFIINDKDETVEVEWPLGLSVLDVAHKNNIDLEGACEGSLACSTCHIIVEDEFYYNKLKKPKEDEEDMLDLAFGLTHTSRLGCQIILTEELAKELDGIRLRLPSATRNIKL